MKDVHQDVANAFGAVLKALRDSAGLSQEDIAERAELDRTYPSLLERGLRSPTLGMFFRIAGALNLDPITLVWMTSMEMKSPGYFKS